MIRSEGGGLSEATIQALERMGHKVNPRGGSGTVAAIQKTAGGYVGVIDPRSAGSALGY
jgi:gamma-glutamyltranspeptidase